MGFSSWLGITSRGSAGEYIAYITLDNSSGVSQTDYQITFNIGPSASFWNFYRDISTINFRDSDKTTLLNYYIESFDAVAKTATMWVKVPTLPSSTHTIYLFYGGNKDYSAYNSSTNTFILYDDFTSNTSANYNISGSVTWDTGNGQINMASGASIIHKTAIVTNAKIIYDVDFSYTNYVICWARLQTNNSINNGYNIYHYRNTFNQNFNYLKIDSTTLSQNGTTMDNPCTFKLYDTTLNFVEPSLTSTNATYSSGYVGLKASGAKTVNYIKVIKTQATEPSVVFGDYSEVLSTLTQVTDSVTGTYSMQVISSYENTLLKSTQSLGDLSTYTGVASGAPIQGTCGLWIKNGNCPISNVGLWLGSDSTNYIYVPGSVYDAIDGFDWQGTTGFTYIVFKLPNYLNKIGNPDWTNVAFQNISINATNMPNLILVDYFTISKSDIIGFNGVGYRTMTKTGFNWP